LQPVDFNVCSGEFVVLVGPSGCGKSTLLRIIAGLEQPTSGEILLDGKPITTLAPADRDVAMVFQSYALYPHMTVAENIGFGLRMRKTPRAEREKAVRETAGLLDLTDLLDRRPGQLSGGQRQRVALGRAIIRRPRLFLFDEPLSNLDAALRASTRAELRRLHARLGATVLYVTHDQVEAMSMADRLVVMNRGVVQQVGPPLEVYRRPLNRFVAGFIGTPSMNFLKVHVSDGGMTIADGRWTDARGLEAGDWIAGLRAEDLSLTPGLPDSAVSATLAATVCFTESLGNETLVTVNLRDGQLVVVRAAGAVVLPKEVSLNFDWQNAVFFDAAGQALTASLDPVAGDAAHQKSL
jgi:multiple sugar transport system ATP-binding protein